MYKKREIDTKLGESSRQKLEDPSPFWLDKKNYPKLWQIFKIYGVV